MPDAPGHASSLPLQPLRLVSAHAAPSTSGASHTRPAVPLAHSSAVPSSLLASKRAASASGPIGKPIKRVKVATGQAGMPKSVTGSTVKPSSLASKIARKPESENSPFKLPAVPERFDRSMTPATSTVAHSSSPRRMDAMFSSSPSRSTATAGPSSSNLPAITLERGTTLIFGRHRKMPHEGLARPCVVDSTIPPTSIHLLHNPKLPGQIIALPRGASHASRIHAAVEYLPLSDSVRVIVLGQNGLRIHGLGAKRVSMKQGERKDVPRTARGVDIDFYGCRVKIMFPPPAEKAEVKAAAASFDTPRAKVASKPALAAAPASSSLASAAPPSPRSSLPPSSPPIATLGLEDVSDTEDQPATESVEAPERAAELEDLFPESDRPESAHSTDSPLSSIMDEDEEPVRLPPASPSKSNGVHADLTEGSSGVAIKREMIETALAGSQKTKARTREPTPESMDEEEEEEKVPLPEGVDMLHILTYSIVFSGSSKLSLPDLVKHMLESQSALKKHGGEEQWELWAHEVLENNAMFGKVERHGKDASGHPLLPHYFYNPAHDPDETRAKELGGLVRPLRAAQRTGGKALDWRPVGSGRRRY